MGYLNNKSIQGSHLIGNKWKFKKKKKKWVFHCYCTCLDPRDYVV